jgi:DNA recombination protein RmuC
MVEHLESVGKNLRQAAQSYDNFVGSLETKVLPSARRFKDLGVATTREIEIVEPLRLDVRNVNKPELTGRTEGDDGDTNLRLLGRRGS